MAAIVPERLVNDRPITISTAPTHRSRTWKLERHLWSKLAKLLGQETRCIETMAEYADMPKQERDARKNVGGGYVAGALEGKERKLAAITGRDIITIDADNLDADSCAQVIAILGAMGCAYCYHSTRSHTPEAPRLRILIPLDRTVSAEEYEPVARRIAESLGMNCIDPVSFRAHQLMYWPTACRDAEFLYEYEDKPFLVADDVLGWYADWRDAREWPRHDADADKNTHAAGHLEDPTKRGGIIGAWCEVYSIPQAIDNFLPDVYTEYDTDRYTYNYGSTVGGSVLYDNGTFLYSHHATDPVGGQCVNSFDLVRIHKFGHLDADAHANTKPANMPSYKAMMEFAKEDPAVKVKRINAKSCELSDFEVVPNGVDDASYDDSWKAKLAVNDRGTVKTIMTNVMLCVENDPNLQGCIRHDRFYGRLVASEGLPWRRGQRVDGTDAWWAESDHSYLGLYLESTYGMMNPKDAIGATLPAIAHKYQFDSLQAYFANLPEWDGVERVETLLIDYIGAEDTPYVRAATRKWMVGAVHRALNPGSKVEQMIVLTGKQGQGKTTLITKLGAGFNTHTVDITRGKKTVEEIQGRWLIEAAELVGMSRAADAELKNFLSQTRDTVRPAYGRYLVDYPRRCVFIGTTNETDFLKDATGGRRFWPVKCLAHSLDEEKFDALTTELVTQIWAEAVQIRKSGGKHYFTSKETELREAATQLQAEYFDEDIRAPVIREFADREIPEGWRTWDLTRRLSYWATDYEDVTIKTAPRNYISVAEIMRECLHIPVNGTRDVHEARAIGRILRQTGVWEPSPHRFSVGPGYGRAKMFKRTGTNGQPNG